MDGENLPRDVRVDRIGYVDELETHYGDVLRKAVKASMLGDKIERVEGDLFQGLLVAGGLTSCIEPEEMLKLYEKKKISREQFLSAIKGCNEPAKQFLSLDQIHHISTRTKSAPRFCVKRKEGVEIKLVDAVRRLSIDIEPPRAA